MTKNERRKFLKASLASLAGISIPGCRSAMCYAQARPEPTEVEAAAEKAAHREGLTEQLKEMKPQEEPLRGAMCYSF